MKKTLVMLLGALATTTATAASYDDFARVISVQEQYRSNGGGRQVCDNNQQHSGSTVGVGTAVGAVTGGLLGAQVGKGNGTVAASAAGAVVGALSGQYIENNNRQPNNGSNCYYTNGDSRPNGYRVTYEYMGRTYTDNFRNPPNGDEIKVRVTVAPTSNY